MENFIDTRAAVSSKATTIGEGTNIHAFVTVENDVTIGKNCNIYPGCYICSGTVIGDDVIVQPNTTFFGSGIVVGDYCLIGSGVHIGPDCKIGINELGVSFGCELTTIGSNSVIEQNVQIDATAHVASGSVVMAKKHLGCGAFVEAASLIDRDVFPFEVCHSAIYVGTNSHLLEYLFGSEIGQHKNQIDCFIPLLRRSRSLEEIKRFILECDMPGINMDLFRCIFLEYFSLQ